MGGGGLRILPHKKWHVWRRDNIERVLKDERENEEKQHDLRAKKRRLEHERRAQQLLSTEGHHDQEQQQHINFFKAEEAQASGRNVAQRKQEIGAEDTLRRHGKLPWYAQTEDTTKKEPTARQERKRKRELEVADPLQHMRPKERGKRLLFAARLEEKEKKRRSLYVDSDEELAASDRRKYSARYDRTLMSPGRGDWHRYNVEDEADKASKKRSKHREKKSKSKHKEAMLQELRRERQEREATERRRAERLM